MGLRLDIRWAPDSEKTTSSETAIVIDVLRAATTTIVALSSGALQVVPETSLEEAEKIRRQNPGSLLLGERNSQKTPGSDLENSPSQISQNITNKTIILSTTNFPRAVKQCDSEHTYIGALINCKKVAIKAYETALENDLDIALMLAGDEGKHAPEDMACAGQIALELEKRCQLSPRAEEALRLVKKEGAEKIVQTSPHAQKLITIGQIQDVEFSAKKNTHPLVPVYSKGVIKNLQTRLVTFQE